MIIVVFPIHSTLLANPSSLIRGRTDVLWQIDSPYKKKRERPEEKM